MPDLILPAAIGELLRPGVPFVAAIVEADYCESHCECPQCGPDAKDRCPSCGPDGYGPPAWLVALRDARCDRVRYVADAFPAKCVNGALTNLAAGYQQPCDNPRCVDGRLLHDVRVECGLCLGSAADPDWSCICGNGSVRCGCLVDVVPVVDEDDDRIETDDDLLATGSPVILFSRNRSDVLTPTHVDALAAACGKPPADWVGMYAVIVNVA